MSLILEALEKKADTGIDDNQPESLANKVIANSSEPRATAKQVNRHSAIQHAPQAAMNAPQVSIGWGILLTIAILSALLLGFWLGKGGQFNQPMSPKETSAVTQRIDKNVQHIAIPQKNTVTSAVNSDKQQAFSAMFENPVNNANAVNANSVKSVSNQVPSNPIGNDISQGKLLTGKSEHIDLSGVSKDLLAKFNEAVIDTNTDDNFIEPIDVNSPKEQNNSSQRLQQAQQNAQEPEINEDLLARAIANADLDEFSKRKLQALENAVESSDAPNSYKALSQMPVSFQQALPKLQFDMHIYASDGAGWVKVNGRDRYEQDTIASGVTLEEITPQEVILRFRGQRFSMPALSSW